MELSARARALSQKAYTQPQMILEIEGLPTFSALPVWRIPRFDDPDLRFDQFDWDKPRIDKNSYDLIDMAGSTTTISQQLSQGKGVAGSVSSLNISLLDKNELLTKIISPGKVIEDILTAKAVVYLNFGNGTHPEDSIPILHGVVDFVDAGAVDVKLRVAHPQGLKRQEVFTKIQTELDVKFRYRNITINGVIYQTRDIVSGLVLIAIISGGIKGQEEVTVTGQTITVKANTTAANPADRSNAGHIVSAIQKSQAAVNLVEAKTVDDEGDTPQSVFPATTLDSSNSITLYSVNGLLEPSADGTFETYVRIGDEIIKYEQIIDNSLVGLTRGCFGTIPQTHEIEDEVASIYRIKGHMRDLALKLMLSQGAPIVDLPVESVAYFDIAPTMENTITFAGINLAKKVGVTKGDFITLKGSENDVNKRMILSVTVTEFGTTLLVDGAPLQAESELEDVFATIESKYNVWPDGLGMQIDQVDVAEHEELVEKFPTEFFSYDFLLDDTIQGDSFIEAELYFPSGCFGIPKEGRVSISKTTPPIAQAETIVLDENNIVNPAGIRIQRTTTENFYNAVIYQYDPDAIEKDLTRGFLKYSENSKQRVKNVKNIPLVIESRGLRDTPETREKMEVQSKRYLDRYQYGAEKIPEFEILYRDGVKLSIGNTVVFGSSFLMLSDSTTGNRKFRPRVMEVANLRLDIQNGRAFVTLINTHYEADGKYGVVGPSSLIDAGSSEGNLRLKHSFGTPPLQLENTKWRKFQGERVIVRKDDWTEQHFTRFVGWDPANPNGMILNPPLPVVPGENWIVEMPPYSETEQDYKWKSMHVFFNPRAYVKSSPAPNMIEVDYEYIDLFLVGCLVEIHNHDYTLGTGDTRITVKEINGNVLTLSRAVDFGMSPGHIIDLIGFKDGGAPYRML